MNIIITNLSKAGKLLLNDCIDQNITHIVSLGGPNDSPPLAYNAHPAKKIRLEFDDVVFDGNDYIAPKEEHVRKLIDKKKMLIHCYAGISRSTAAALIFMSLFHDLQTCKDKLLELTPWAQPNKTMIGFADKILEHNGKFLELREEIYDLTKDYEW